MERKDRGLADLETGSECYLSEMLDFDFEEGDEGEETSEEDLLHLNIEGTNFELKEMLLNFFRNLLDTNKDYLKTSVKALLKDDIALLKKHVDITELMV